MTREEYDQRKLNGGAGAANLPPWEEFVKLEAEREAANSKTAKKEKPNGDA